MNCPLRITNFLLVLVVCFGCSETSGSNPKEELSKCYKEVEKLSNFLEATVPAYIVQNEGIHKEGLSKFSEQQLNELIRYVLFFVECDGYTSLVDDKIDFDYGYSGLSGPLSSLKGIIVKINKGDLPAQMSKFLLGNVKKYYSQVVDEIDKLK